ncbi:MAG: VOC family protein [Haloferacaceae archaeon]
MDLRIDHVTVAGDDLSALEADLSAAGLTPAYGGEHSNGATHMALLGFEDGSYVELISATSRARAAGRDDFWWADRISENAGPAAWAVRSDGIERDADRLRSVGVEVDGPSGHERERDDGVTVAWELAFPGPGEPGSLLPFLIEDRTPRRYRVTPTEGVADGPIRGVETVVGGVPALDAAVETLRTAFELDPPTEHRAESFGATVASFSDAPVALATPLGDSWLSARLDRFGTCPCAFLLRTDDLDAAAEALAVGERERLAGRRVAWLDVKAARIGVVESDG